MSHFRLHPCEGAKNESGEDLVKSRKKDTKRRTSGCSSRKTSLLSYLKKDDSDTDLSPVQEHADKVDF